MRPSRVKATEQYMKSCQFPETGKGRAIWLRDPDSFLLSDYKRNFTQNRYFAQQNANVKKHTGHFRALHCVDACLLSQHAYFVGGGRERSRGSW